MITRIRLSPPRLERAKWYDTVRGQVHRAIAEESRMYTLPFGIYIPSFMDGEWAYLTPRIARAVKSGDLDVWINDLAVRRFVAEYVDQMKIMVITSVLCGDLCCVVYSFL